MSSRNYIGTFNNPTCSLTEFMEKLEAYPRAKAGIAQVEKGKEGTIHIQWMVSLADKCRPAALRKYFAGSHIEMAKNALASWEYCGKEDTRVEGPLQFGIPPAAKNVKGDTKKRNQMILEYGAVRAVEEGLIQIDKFK